MPYVRLNGFDVLPFIKDRGIHWEEDDIEGPNSVRTMDGKEHPDTITEKRRIQIDLNAMTISETRPLFAAIKGESWIFETDIDPEYGIASFEAKCKKKPATCLVINDGVPLWDEISIPIIEL